MSDITEHPGWQWERKITLGDLIQLVLILIAMLLGWFKLDYRVSALEAARIDNAAQQVSLTKAVTDLNDTIGKLNQQLLYFPPHRHLEGNIEYPDGRVAPLGGAFPQRPAR